MQSEVFFRIHLFLWLGRHHDREPATRGRDLAPLASLIPIHHWSKEEEKQQCRGKSFTHQLSPHIPSGETPESNLWQDYQSRHAGGDSPTGSSRRIAWLRCLRISEALIARMPSSCAAKSPA